MLSLRSVLTVLLAVGLLFAAGAAQAGTMSTLADGLLSYVPVDGNTNAFTDDWSTTYGTGGTAYGATSYQASVFAGNSITATYNNGYVGLNDDLGAMVDNGGTYKDFSISFWAWSAGSYGNPAICSNCAWDTAEGGKVEGVAFLNPLTGTLGTNWGAYINFWDGTLYGGRINLTPTTQVWKAQTWQNLILTVDRDGLSTFYVDGVVAAQVASKNGPIDGAYNFAMLSSGKGEQDSAVRGIYGPHMDDWAMWDRTLTSTEIAQISTKNYGASQSVGDIINGVPEPGTIAMFLSGMIGLLAYAWRKRK